MSVVDPNEERAQSQASPWVVDGFLGAGSMNANFVNASGPTRSLTPHALAIAALLVITIDRFSLRKEADSDEVIATQADRAPFILLAYREATLLEFSPVDPSFELLLDKVTSVNEETGPDVARQLIEELPALLGAIKLYANSAVGIEKRNTNGNAVENDDRVFGVVRHGWDIPLAAATQWLEETTQRLEADDIDSKSFDMTTFSSLLQHPQTAGNASYVGSDAELTAENHTVHYLLLASAAAKAKAGEGEEAGITAIHALKLAREAQDAQAVVVAKTPNVEPFVTGTLASQNSSSRVGVSVPTYIRSITEAAEGIEGLVLGRDPREVLQLLTSATQSARQSNIATASHLPRTSQPSVSQTFGPQLSLPVIHHFASVAQSVYACSALSTHTSILSLQPPIVNTSLGDSLLAGCRLVRGLIDSGFYKKAARTLDMLRDLHSSVIKGPVGREWRRCAAELVFWRAIRRGEISAADSALGELAAEAQAGLSGSVAGLVAGRSGFRAGMGDVQSMRGELAKRAGDIINAAKILETWAEKAVGVEKLAAIVEVARLRIVSLMALVEHCSVATAGNNPAAFEVLFQSSFCSYAHPYRLNSLSPS
ncbi:hypothetical protein HDU93_007169 [Gonapodya sp. JEL0774]|nr:hypothetical protein HDU93_007169 [Gonapodya sp. JEL0774]